MDWHDVAIALFGVVIAVGGWLFKALYSNIERLRGDFMKLPETYVRRDDYRIDMQYIREKLDTIVDRLPPRE